MVLSQKVLKGFRVTEKASTLAANVNQYTFRVATDANRTQVAEAVEKTFKVDVVRVNIINTCAKYKRARVRGARPGIGGAFKKAIVTLKEGQKIEMV